MSLIQPRHELHKPDRRTAATEHSSCVPPSLAGGLQLDGLQALVINHLGGICTDVLLPSLVSRWDRLLLFGGLNLAAAAMFIIGFVLVPTGVFLIKPRKFVVL
jgi:hypothetical protein